MEKKLEKTKDLLLIEALKLFAARGYDAVTVAEIAKAVGCTASAIYKHYESKQALFDALMEESRNAFAARLSDMNVDFYSNPKKRKEFIEKSEEDQIKIFMEFFIRTMNDEMPCLFRKMLTIEQFNHPEFAALYNERYIDAQINSLEKLFQEFIDAKIMKDDNARNMAIQFYAPGYMLICLSDRSPEKREEVLKSIEIQIRHFLRNYKI